MTVREINKHLDGGTRKPLYWFPSDPAVGQNFRIIRARVRKGQFQVRIIFGEWRDARPDEVQEAW